MSNQAIARHTLCPDAPEVMQARRVLSQGHACYRNVDGVNLCWPRPYLAQSALAYDLRVLAIF